MKDKSKIKVVELFAGVGGFRVGFEKYAKKYYDFIFSNQWEPGKSHNSQHAFKILQKHYSDDTLSNEDIKIAKDKIPENFDVLVGGFPCQDYSVATVNANGIKGKKGVLWWEITDILKKHKPKVFLFENVDRILKSPRDNPGKDFAIILKSLELLGYDVEWSIINGADYGMPQRRKRIFIIGYYKKLNKFNSNWSSYLNYSLINKSFRRELIAESLLSINLTKYKNEAEVTDKYNGVKFNSSGIMMNGNCYSWNFTPLSNFSSSKKLEDIIEKNTSVMEYEFSKEQIERISKLKKGGKIPREKNGFKYFYTMGKMSLVDDLQKPSRTMLTSETTINRSTHVIKQKINNKIIYRSLTPIEAERLNGFEDNWTYGIPERYRFFCMGNALIIDIVGKLGLSIAEYLKENK